MFFLLEENTFENNIRGMRAAVLSLIVACVWQCASAQVGTKASQYFPRGTQKLFELKSSTIATRATRRRVAPASVL